MEFTGKIIYVSPIKRGVSEHTDKAWAKISFVVEQQNVQFPEKALFEVFGEDRINQMPIVAGNEVTVSFDIDASQYNARWYNTLRAWRVVAAQQQPAAAPAAPATPVPPTANNPAPNDLPFDFWGVTQ